MGLLVMINENEYCGCVDNYGLGQHYTYPVTK
jgi:hypothetical protein